MLWALLLSLRGSACVYEGEELALPEADIPYEQIQDPYGKALWPEFKGGDGCRTPMPWRKNAPNGGFTTGQPWLPVLEEHRARAVDVEEGDPKSTLARCRAFTQWRKGTPALQAGDIAFIDCPDDCLLFTRKQEDNVVLAAFNLSGKPATLPVPGTGWKYVDALGFGRSDGKTIELGPYDACFMVKA